MPTEDNRAIDGPPKGNEEILGARRPTLKADAGVVRDHLVAVVTVPPFPVDNGFSLRVANVLRELGRRWSITLLTPPARAGYPYPTPIPGVDRLELGALDGNQTFESWRNANQEFRLHMDKLVKELNPSALLVWGGAEMVLFNRPEYPPAVVDHVDCWSLTVWRQLRMERSLRKKAQVIAEFFRCARFERKVGRWAYSIALVGEADARLMQRLAPRSRLHVISNGVAALPEAALQGSEAPCPVVVFTGGLDYPPNVNATLYFVQNVLPRIRKVEPSAIFRIAGRAPGPEVRALHGTPGVEMMFDLPDMHAALGDAWLSVAPMRSGSGVKNKILEAWAAGKPVVMTKLAANGLAMDEDSQSLVTDDADEMAAIIVELFRNPERRRQLGLAGRWMVSRHHTWAGVASKLDSLLEEAAGSGRRATQSRSHEVS